MVCSRCIKPMKRVLRFNGKTSYELYKCPICGAESKPTPFILDGKNLSLCNDMKRYGGV